MRTKELNRKMITINLDIELLDRLNVYIREKGYCRNKIIEKIIRRHLDEANHNSVS